MSTGFETVRERMAEYLNARGVPARTAWPKSGREELEAPVAVVSLRGCKAGPAGFQDYLGERYDQETGRWEELYGRKAELTLGLDLYQCRDGDGEDLQTAFDALAQALLQGGPEGLALVEFSCGETEYDAASRLLRRPVQAVCLAYLCAAAQEGDLFTDFELRGGLKG